MSERQVEDPPSKVLFASFRGGTHGVIRAVGVGLIAAGLGIWLLRFADRWLPLAPQAMTAFFNPGLVVALAVMGWVLYGIAFVLAYLQERTTEHQVMLLVMLLLVVCVCGVEMFGRVSGEALLELQAADLGDEPLVAPRGLDDDQYHPRLLPSPYTPRPTTAGEEALSWEPASPLWRAVDGLMSFRFHTLRFSTAGDSYSAAYLENVQAKLGVGDTSAADATSLWYLAIDDQNLSALMMRAKTLHTLGRTDEALEAVEQASERLSSLDGDSRLGASRWVDSYRLYYEAAAAAAAGDSELAADRLVEYGSAWPPESVLLRVDTDPAFATLEGAWRTGLERRLSGTPDSDD